MQAGVTRAPSPSGTPRHRSARGSRHCGAHGEADEAGGRKHAWQQQALFSGGHMFYDRLNGVMPLTPQEQKAVGRILAACGAAEPVEFDAYTELFDFSLRLTSDELVKRQEV